ncbi:MAG: thioredoxin-disulfide reductase [Thermodesulfobacteria bacterium]|nr:thioredoxin-disulfide reductase [Thermodesulfobacteriota bacterium]
MTHDVIIIGGGPAGLAAAIYAGRAKLDGFVLEKMSPGGQVLITDRVENYPGFPEGLTGFELVEKFSAHAQKFGMKIENGEVASIEPVGDLLNISLTDQRTITTRSIIVATGATHRKLGVKGEDEFIGRGVSYCATCDGPFFRDQVVAVVGGGDSAVQEAIFLTRFAKKVYLIHRRDELRAIKVLADRAKENDKIEFVWDSVVEEIEGDDQVRSLKILNRKTGETSTLKVDGVFIFIGIVPVTDFVKGLVETDEMGFIKTDQWMRTSVKGVYAAGDCRQKPLLQIVTAVAEGATAAYAVEHDLA